MATATAPPPPSLSDAIRAARAGREAPTSALGKQRERERVDAFLRRGVVVPTGREPGLPKRFTGCRESGSAPKAPDLAARIRAERGGVL